MTVNPEIIRWARERVGRAPVSFKNLPVGPWESGIAEPTLRQLERYARATRTPIGYFFLDEPPGDDLPIPDLRAADGLQPKRASPELLDMVYCCQRRQEWCCDSVRRVVLLFACSATLNSPVEDVAADIRRTLKFEVADRRDCGGWAEALPLLSDRAEKAGIFVMRSDRVGSDPRRRFNADEFVGFALCHWLAPVVFINDAGDSAAQLFTLAHELAHVWLGESGVSGIGAAVAPRVRPNAVEDWCNRVAAETLVPLAALKSAMIGKSLEHAVELLDVFKVSPVVMLRRLCDAEIITRFEFNFGYARESAKTKKRRPARGDRCRKIIVGTGRRFAAAVARDALGGQTPLCDAYDLLGVATHKQFESVCKLLEVI